MPIVSLNGLEKEESGLGVVYFDQHLGAAHPKRWSKYVVFYIVLRSFLAMYSQSPNRGKKQFILHAIYWLNYWHNL